MTNFKSGQSMGIEKTLVRMFGLSGRNAIVTGAASGLGKRMATVLCSLGACVYFADLDESKAILAAEETANNCNGVASGLYINVTNPDSVISAFQRIAEEITKLDILICSAGTSGACWIEEMSIDLWNRVLNVNLTGSFLCCQEAVKLMIPNHWGRIVNIASIAATHAPRPERFNGGYNYSASKAGVVGMTKRLAVELAPYNITANCISPGIMLTPLTEKALADEKTNEQTTSSIPLGRVGEPEDLDGLVGYMCSTSSAYLTGQDILIDGGYSVW